MNTCMNVVIGSAGRRLYLLRWFREAMDALGIQGKIIVTEGDPSSAAFTAADEGVLMPPYSDPYYEEAMLQMVDEYQPALFISVNDWELAKLGNGLGDKLRDRGVVVPGVSDSDIDKVTDKFRLKSFLVDAGIRTPHTVLASDATGVAELKESSSRMVVKDRLGSGSSGLQIVESSELDTTLTHIARTHKSRDTKEKVLDDIVVQPFIHGVEYGVDIVGTFENPKDRKFHVLARRKIRMRAGETDKAETVDSEAFSEVAAELGRVLKPIGLIDVDVLRDTDGVLHVIDINPRFGGGYPFVHLAGANVPLYYLSALLGRSVDHTWAQYRAGIVAAKFEEIRVSDSGHNERLLGGDL